MAAEHVQQLVVDSLGVGIQPDGSPHFGQGARDDAPELVSGLRDYSALEVHAEGQCTDLRKGQQQQLLTDLLGVILQCC
jgi:hypothetical protein